MKSMTELAGGELCLPQRVGEQSRNFTEMGIAIKQASPYKSHGYKTSSLTTVIRGMYTFIIRPCHLLLQSHRDDSFLARRLFANPTNLLIQDLSTFYLVSYNIEPTKE